MKHVFVETNWVVAYCAPPHARLPAAVELAQRAEEGEVRLYLPSICLTEAIRPIRTRYKPREAADSVRQYLASAHETGKLNDDYATVRRILDQYQTSVTAYLERLEDQLMKLRVQPGMDVFALNDRMLSRAVELASTKNLDLKPFDQAILAAVLVRAKSLREEGAKDISFCELDSDLQYWEKRGGTKEPLTGLYESAGVSVYGDFAFQVTGPRPSRTTP
jgi:hypothetical protein